MSDGLLHSAQIYRFPTKPRAGLRGGPEKLRTGNDAPSQIVTVAGFGSWYHEAAIKEDQGTRRH